MAITLILIKKIISLFLIVFAGFLLVKLKLLKASDSKSISVLSLYLITPCVVVSAFEVDFTPEIQGGLLLAVVAAVLSQGLLAVLSELMSKFLHFDPVEKASVIFSNAGNLIIPLVTAMLGPEWVIYTSAYIAVQLFLMWSYGKAMLCGEKRLDLKKVLTNANMIAIFIGVILLVTGLRLPPVIQDAADSLGAMLGPAAMLVTGMLIAGMNLGKALRNRRLWLVVAVRLVVLPLCILALLKFSGLARFAAEGKTILLMTLLATITPSASTITNMAVVYGRDADYASAINVTTTLLCVVTMPAVVALYLL